MNVVELTQRLVTFDTVNPPGNEDTAMRFCAELLSRAGFDCQLLPMAAGRTNLIATRGLQPGWQALGFTGHLDTVPLGAAPWWVPPQAGIIEDGRLYGRGSTDMKGGVAAFIAAAAVAKPPPGGLVLLLTAGEETGAEGARVLAEQGRLPQIGALLVGEPTLNRAVSGHKGALWLRLRARGVTAHGSMPESGVNAVLAMVGALKALEGFNTGPVHPVMGHATLNIGTITGGLNTNSVPDLCEATLDLRSVPGLRHDQIEAEIAARLGPAVEIERLIDLPTVWTDPDHPWVRAMIDLTVRLARADTAPSAVSYFTDASIFTGALGDVPTVLIGPGDPVLAHQTDEYVDLARLHEAQAIYAAAIAGWAGRVAKEAGTL